jgi:hypothetical protein
MDEAKVLASLGQRHQYDIVSDAMPRDKPQTIGRFCAHTRAYGHRKLLWVPLHGQASCI